MSRDTENKVERLENYLLSNYEFRYNEVLKETEYKIKGKSSDFKPLEERELADLRIRLSKAGYTGIKGILDDLLKSSSLAKDFNPFIEYYKSLPKWSPGDFDYITELCSYVDVKEDQVWFRRMLEKHLLRTVACSLRRIDFNKHCFVFLGKQHDGKTSFIRYLTPDPLKGYYKENPPLDHKDSVIALSQNLLINLDEMHNLNKTDANKVKSLFSQSDTKVRNHYGVKDTLQTRYASFFGTTNEREFLNDVTGNVRWLIFTIEGILHDHGGEKGYSQRVDIDRVWSQAYALVLAGETGILKADEIKKIEMSNRAFQMQTPEIELISELFEPCDKNMANAVALSTTELQMSLQYFMDEKMKFNNIQVGRALTFLGFVKESVRDKSRNISIYKYYVKTTNDKILEFFAKKPTTLTTSLQIHDN